jgi:spectinomycin phosphotransferase
MLEKPALQDDTLLVCMRDAYGVSAIAIEFLPLGNDSTAWAYRVQTDAGVDYFLKVKKGIIPQASLTIPHFLNVSHIAQVVAPLPTQDQKLSQPVGDFTLILYPFIEGETGMEKGLSDALWIELGLTLKAIHSIILPDALSSQLSRETFVPAWARLAKELHAEILSQTYDDGLERELAAFWRAKHAEIKTIIQRCEELGKQLQDQTLDFVLCHTDIHTANVLIDQQERLHIVDWDAPLLAPRERDLMFMVGSDQSTNRSETLFLSGYGKTPINPMALAYYRYEWVVQEIGDFAERVFRMPDLGTETKHEAVEGFKKLFTPGNVVDVAYQTGS